MAPIRKRTRPRLAAGFVAQQPKVNFTRDMRGVHEPKGAESGPPSRLRRASPHVD
jgi:hypothetical protein